MVLIYASLLPGFIKPFGDFSEKKSLEQKWKKGGKRKNFALFSTNSHIESLVIELLEMGVVNILLLLKFMDIVVKLHARNFIKIFSAEIL